MDPIKHSTRILYIAGSKGISIHQSGGAGTHIRGTVQGFNELGYDVFVLLGGDVLKVEPPSDTENEIPQNPKLRTFIKKLLPNRLRLLLRDVRTIVEDRRFLKLVEKSAVDFNPDIIYERSCYLSTVGTALAKKLKIVHYLESDGRMVEIIDKDYGVFSKRVANFIEKIKIGKADRVVLLNQTSRKYVQKKFNVPERKCLVKTLGVDVSSFQFNQHTVHALKKKYALESKFVVGFAGSISSYHGVSYLVDAASILAKKSIHDVIFLIIGWSKEAEKLKAATSKQGIHNLVFTGKVDKAGMPDYYRLFDVGVVPDSDEAIYPIKVLEYGMAGTCPVVPDYDIFKELIKPDIQGFYFKRRDASSLAQTIIFASRNRDLLRTCANNWRHQVETGFSWKSTVSEIHKSILDLNVFDSEKPDTW